MGTVASFQVVPGSSCTVEEAETAVEASVQLLREADTVFSSWAPESPMSAVRSGARPLEQAPPEVAEVLSLCREARELSGGWFDPWAMPGGVDPTGMVKGWAVERALGPLAAADVGSALVNAGGDVAFLGRPPTGERWRVGIRHPWRADAFACVLGVVGSIATSGCYERGSHLIDPRGASIVAAASATVTGPSLALADALATALAVGGTGVLELLRRLDGYEGYLVHIDGSEEYTEGVVFA